MDILISWSGDRSWPIAKGLKTLLEMAIPQAKPWIAEDGIESGAVWFERLIAKIRECQMCILCLNKGNIGAQWLAFEAGALSASRGNADVCPYLVDVHPVDLPLYLSQFKARVADRDDTQELLLDINRALPEADPRREGWIARHFNEALWPTLEKQLLVATALPPDPPTPLEALHKRCEDLQANLETHQAKIETLSVLMKRMLRRKELELSSAAP